MSRIEVESSARGSGWVVRVVVTDRGASRDFEVLVSAAEIERFEPGAVDPTQLVRRSFEFLLARESKESILRSFELSVIGRYFPEYESEIRRGRGA